MAIHKLLLAALVSSTNAVKLYVANYALDGPVGQVSTLEFTPGVGAGDLRTIATNEECGSAPSWLDQTLGPQTLICVDEGFQTPNASINTLSVSQNGTLARIAQVDTIQGPVSTQFYNGKKAVALAHYGGSAISTFKVVNNTSFAPLQNFVFNTPPGYVSFVCSEESAHGANESTRPRPEQEASHVHHSVIDPTGKFLVFPDLGADVVHVYSIDCETSLLTEQPSLTSPSAYGPRHATFWTPQSTVYGQKPDTYLFVIHELANRIISYKVTYPTANTGGLTFTAVQEVGLYGDRADPVGTRAAEITVSPDNMFVMASNRNATIFTVPNGDPNNSTEIPSDSLVTFKPSADGKLSFVQLAPSGGSFPRHFKFSGDGSKVAVANQNTMNVDIWARDVTTGMLGERLASAVKLPGQVTNVVWG